MRKRRQQKPSELHSNSHLLQDGAYGGSETQKYAMEAQSHAVHEMEERGVHEMGEHGARSPDAELAAPQKPVELDGTSRVN
jgi:hypothetical protein